MFLGNVRVMCISIVVDYRVVLATISRSVVRSSQQRTAFYFLASCNAGQNHGQRLSLGVLFDADDFFDKRDTDCNVYQPYSGETEKSSVSSGYWQVSRAMLTISPSWAGTCGKMSFYFSNKSIEGFRYSLYPLANRLIHRVEQITQAPGIKATYTLYLAEL